MVQYIILWLTLFLILPFRLEFNPLQASAENMKMEHNNKLNHLAEASSPYLQAHADNPVDWYPWGQEAFDRANSEDKPIFLSIGYNACHWCHVMEHESFENEEIAGLLNEHFISIKVDREERPDIDQIYMTAVTAMTGGGGWPMSIFMTSDKKPFFAGTYFPPQGKYGRPGFKEVIMELAKAYRESRTDIFKSADAIADHIAANSSAPISSRTIDKDVLISAANALYSAFDSRYGGFGQAPKFPQAVNLSLLLRASHLSGDNKYAQAALTTLRKMAEGGIYDQLGGGFHRYSVDDRWLVPHFEKMLYDNALLTIPYLEAYQFSGEKYYLDIVDGILGYIRSEMTDPEGGFYSTQDADSEGEEGKFYTWTPDEIKNILEEDHEWFCGYYDIKPGGNFEHGRSIPNIGDHSISLRKNLPDSDEQFNRLLRQAKSKVLEVRKKRIAPATDDKILSSWNGLAISAFAQAYQVTGNEAYLNSARRAADFILNKMTEGNRLFHSYRQGKLLRIELLEDYAYFVAGLIDLYQASFDEKYLNRAKILAGTTGETFSENNIFYLSPADDAALIFRPRDLTDGATPAPSSVMISNLLRLGHIAGNSDYSEQGEKALEAVSGLAARIPRGSASLILAGYFLIDEPLEIVVTGNDPEKMQKFNRELFSRFIPNKVIVGSINGGKSDLPLLEGRQEDDQLTYYFCRNRTCRLPVTNRNDLLSELEFVTESN